MQFSQKQQRYITEPSYQHRIIVSILYVYTDLNVT